MSSIRTQHVARVFRHSARRWTGVEDGWGATAEGFGVTVALALAHEEEDDDCHNRG